MKRRLLSVFLCTSMVASLAAGCGGQPQADSGSNAEGDAAKGDTTIKVAALETGYGSDM